MAEAIKTKVALKKPDGSLETVDRILLALNEDEALSIRMICQTIGGDPSLSRRRHFTGGNSSIDTALRNLNIKLPEIDGEFPSWNYYEGYVSFIGGV